MHIPFKSRTNEDVIGASNIIDPKGCRTAIGGGQIGKGIISALGARCLSMSHKDTMMQAVTNGDVVKLILTAGAHENAKVIGRQNGIADDVMIKSKIEGDARTWIIMQI